MKSPHPHSQNGLRYVLRPSLRLTSRLYSQELEKKFDPENLKKKRVTSFCNKTWSQYKLMNQEKWLPNGPLNYNTSLQFDLFCCSLGSNLYGTQSGSRSKRLMPYVSFCCCPIPSFPSVSPSTRCPGPGLFPIFKSLGKNSPKILKNPRLTPPVSWGSVVGEKEVETEPSFPLFLQVPVLLQILLIKPRHRHPRGTIPAGTTPYRSIHTCDQSQCEFEHSPI